MALDTVVGAEVWKQSYRKDNRGLTFLCKMCGGHFLHSSVGLYMYIET